MNTESGQYANGAGSHFRRLRRQIAQLRRTGTLILCDRHRDRLRAEATRNATASRVGPELAAYWRQFGAV
jgi:hypothetical protein